jgi:tetratricopeptide (TPR) repeat protein
MRYILILFLFWSTTLFGQEPTSDLQKWNSLNELLSMNLKFPSAELEDEKTARVILSMKIDDLGRPDSIFLIEGASEAFNSEVLRVVDLATAQWKPEFLENRPAGNEYLWVFSFSANVTDGMPSNDYRLLDNLMKREKFDKAIELCTQKIAKNPYQYFWFEKRSEANRFLGNTIEAQRDYMAAKQIKRKVLAEAEVMAIGRMLPKSGIPGTIGGTNFQ